MSPQVIQGCGNPKVNPQGSGPEEKRRRGKLAPRERPPSGTLEKLVSGPSPVHRTRHEGGRQAGAGGLWQPSGLTAARQVSEAKAQLRDVQDFWISLPGTLCSEKMALSTASDDRCWNGMARGR